MNTKQPYAIALRAGASSPSRASVDLLSDQMNAWKVSIAVGNVKNDQPELLAPI